MIEIFFFFFMFVLHFFFFGFFTPSPPSVELSFILYFLRRELCFIAFSSIRYIRVLHFNNISPHLSSFFSQFISSLFFIQKLMKHFICFHWDILPVFQFCMREYCYFSSTFRCGSLFCRAKHRRKKNNFVCLRVYVIHNISIFLLFFFVESKLVWFFLLVRSLWPYSFATLLN